MSAAPVGSPSHAAASSTRATAIGFGAIASWSTLATLTAWQGDDVDPFATMAVTFFIGGTQLAGVAVARGRASAMRPTLAPFLLALGGLFGYHALYFTALASAPPAEAGLVAAGWALLTVVFVALLPGHRLTGRTVAGAMVGFAGVVLVVGGAGDTGSGGGDDRVLGLALAAIAAVVWAAYSVASRLVAATPSESLALPCLVTALLAALIAGWVEGWSMPPAGAWPALVLIGIGPVGGAFALWDIGMKRGDIATLGVLASASPVLSSVLLMAVGRAEPTAALALGSMLVAVAGVVVLRR